jgi:hypothetical protein
MSFAIEALEEDGEMCAFTFPAFRVVGFVFQRGVPFDIVTLDKGVPFYRLHLPLVLCPAGRSLPEGFRVLDDTFWGRPRRAGYLVADNTIERDFALVGSRGRPTHDADALADVLLKVADPENREAVQRASNALGPSSLTPEEFKKMRRDAQKRQVIEHVRKMPWPDF